MEVTLEEIVDAIEKVDAVLLQDLLKQSSDFINDYCVVDDVVLMTPLLFAVKMKSADCVDVLILKGAKLELSIKMLDPDHPGDETKHKSLHTNALEYAYGEQKKAADEDILKYAEIIEILKEAKAAKKNKKTPQKTPQAKPAQLNPAQLNLIPSTQNVPIGMDNILMSPTVVADNHRIAQRTIQNQNAIKKLTEENESLKKDVEHLKKEIEHFKPWIIILEKWVYQGGPPRSPQSGGPQPIADLKDSTEGSPESDKSPKKRHRSLAPPKQQSPTKGTRPKRESEGPSKSKSKQVTQSQQPISTSPHSKNPMGRSVSENPRKKRMDEKKDEEKDEKKDEKKGDKKGDKKGEKKPVLDERDEDVEEKKVDKKKGEKKPVLDERDGDVEEKKVDKVKNNTKPSSKKKPKE